jgi:hypothetical protein
VLRLERAITITEQNRNPRYLIEYSDIRFPVSIEVADSDGQGVHSDRIFHRSPIRAVSIVEQHRYVIGQLVCRCEIGLSVTVEVRNNYGKWPGTNSIAPTSHVGDVGWRRRGKSREAGHSKDRKDKGPAGKAHSHTTGLIFCGG